MEDCLKRFYGEPRLPPVFPWYLTQVLMTADGCIKTSGVGGQTLIARVEHTAGLCLPQPERYSLSRRSLVKLNERRSERRLATSVRPALSRAAVTSAADGL